MQYTLFDNYTVIPPHVTIDYDPSEDIFTDYSHTHHMGLSFNYLDMNDIDVKFDINMIFSLKESRIFFRVDVLFKIISGIFIDDTFYVVNVSTAREPVFYIRTAIDSATTTEIKHFYPINKCTLIYTDNGTYLKVLDEYILCEDISIHNSVCFGVDIFDTMKNQMFLEIRWDE